MAKVNGTVTFDALNLAEYQNILEQAARLPLMYKVMSVNLAKLQITIKMTDATP